MMVDRNRCNNKHKWNSIADSVKEEEKTTAPVSTEVKIMTSIMMLPRNENPE
jgi:hypothetical protein